MDKNVCRIKVIFEHLDKEFSVKEFSDRLLLQKLIYFSQFAGIDLGYRYSWYRFGPYSTDLTEAGYRYSDSKSSYDRESSKFKLSAVGRDNLKKVRSLIEDNPTDLETADWLELAASIHYLKHIAHLPGGVSQDNIVEQLLSRGKEYFTKEDIDSSWGILERKGLIERPNW
ncbi:MAG: hypothetical protein KAT79_01625 [candidate division Zixibacteria bacterium]|nr:hypothetical protein [candidate division Zixibacteria bacterium]